MEHSARKEIGGHGLRILALPEAKKLGRSADFVPAIGFPGKPFHQWPAGSSTLSNFPYLCG